MHQVPGLYVASTDHAGRGVFTNEEIKIGDLIEICPIIPIPKYQLPIIHKTVLHDYYFLWGEELDQCAIALGLGSLYNHKINPNANFILDIEHNTIDIIAIKDIAAGQEITLNYHGDPGIEDGLWFDVL